MTFRALLLLIALVAAAIGTPPALAQQPPQGAPLPMWGPNGTVWAVARVGNTLMAGGEFDYIGPPTGAMATVDIDDASSIAGAGQVRGPLYLGVASDGHGGWFVVPARSWQRVNNVAADQVLHVLADGSRDPAWPIPVLGPDNAGQPAAVGRLFVEGTRLYVSGSFTSVNGVARRQVAALDIATGAVTPFALALSDATPAPSVGVVAVAPGQVFIKGSFTAVDGVPRAGLAAVDSSTGGVRPFAPAGVTDIRAATVSTVYTSCPGSFFSVCAYDAVGAPLPAWTRVELANGTPVEASPSAVFLASFEGGAWRILALDPATGTRLPNWIPPALDAPLGALHTQGGRLFIGGDFTRVNGSPRLRLAAADLSTGALANWAPVVGGGVRGLAGHGNRIALTGNFNSVGGQAKRNLAAFDLTTGLPRPAPDTSVAVRAIHAIGDIVVAAGADGAAGAALAFSAASGVAYPWSLSTDGTINALASTDRYLFLRGQFYAAEGQPRNGLAAVDLGTASLSPLNQAAVWAYGPMAISNGVVYTGGLVPIPGANLPIVVALDANTLQRLPFTPSPMPGLTTGFGFAPGRVLLSGSMPGQPRQAMWFSADSGRTLPRTSSQNFVGGVVGQWGSTIYVSGASDPGLAPQFEIIDAASGTSAPWTPGLDDGQGALVRAVFASDDVVVLGGMFSVAGGSLVNNLAVFRAPPAGAPRQITASLDFPVLTLGWQAGASPAPAAFVVEVGGAAGQSNIGRFNVGLVTTVSGHLPPGRSYLRVRGLTAAGEGPPSSEVIFDVPAPAAPPSSPGTLSASVAGNVVSFAWQAATGNATAYVLEAGSAPGLANLVMFPTGNLDTSFAVPAPPGRYYVRIRAVNAFGIGPATNEVTVVVP